MRIAASPNVRIEFGLPTEGWGNPIQKPCSQRGQNMKVRRELDFSKLFGFDAVSEELSGSVDFQNDDIEATLGAKVGKPINFQSEAIEAKLGAKVGKPELAPVTLEEAGYKR
jgi:hypothetical protein